MDIAILHSTRVGREPVPAHDQHSILRNHRKGDQLCKEDLSLQIWSPPETGLAADTIADMRLTFEGYGHTPSAEMWTALRAGTDVLEAMSESRCSPQIYLSSLDPGVGKTEMVVHFVRRLLASEQHRNVAALICVRRLEQIDALVAEANLDPTDFAVLTSDKEGRNLLGCADPDSARVLFTTQSMIESRCKFRTFSDVSAFHYRGKPRDVRVWDEAILPGNTLTVSRDMLASLLLPLRPRYPALTADIDSLIARLASISSGETLYLEDLGAKHGVGRDRAMEAVSNGPSDQVLAVETLWLLFGRHVSVRHDGIYGNTILDYCETLPEDLKPLLVLDASVRVRTAYRLWDDRRGGVTILPRATKDYRNHTIHVWRHSGGKSAFRRHGNYLIQGILNTLDTKPDEEWLVIHHKDALDGDFENVVRQLMPGGAPHVQFLHWGAHDATNRYAHVHNVILAGTLFFRTSHYEALGRLAAAHPSADGPFAKSDLDDVVIGEHCHLILQALCRGAVRKCEGGSCPPSHTYIIASPRTGIEKALPDIFPGVTVKPWEPVARVLSGKVAAAFAYITARIEEDAKSFITFRQVMSHLGWKDTKLFKRRIRQHDDFINALQAAEVEEWGSGRWTTGFRHMPL